MKTVQLVELALTGLRLGYQKCGSGTLLVAVNSYSASNKYHNTLGYICLP